MMMKNQSLAEIQPGMSSLRTPGDGINFTELFSEFISPKVVFE
jgi:hypothetical protein